jgi:hypothetical protein
VCLAKKKNHDASRTTATAVSSTASKACCISAPNDATTTQSRQSCGIAATQSESDSPCVTASLHGNDATTAGIHEAEQSTTTLFAATETAAASHVATPIQSTKFE